jgi:hypothetical protein
VGEYETVRPVPEPVAGVERGRGPAGHRDPGGPGDDRGDPGPAGTRGAPGHPGSTVRAVAAIGTLALAWFLVSWRVLGSPVVDAIGETAGGVLAVLVVVSVVGSLRRGAR